MASTWGNQIRYGEFEIVGAREGHPCLLGEGSFGKTFEAFRSDSVAGHVLRDDFALKVLNPAQLASESKKLQFIQELQALTKFKHPNLIHYIRAGVQGSECFYAMELCRGRDLSRLVERCGMLPERLAALIALQVASGLKEIHQKHGLVHRDIKPSNIMLVSELAEGLSPHDMTGIFEDDEGLCRIVDFGLVDFRSGDDDAPGAAPRGSFKGSPMYASPEQVQKEPLDGRSDIYSLGMTIWFLVQGRGPLLDKKGREIRDAKDALRRHTSPEEHLASLPTGLSAPFREILARMVAKDPDRRFASAAELQTALRRYLLENPAVARPTSSLVKLSRPLEDEYSLEGAFPSRVGRKCYRARRKSSGETLKLTMVEDLEADLPSGRVDTTMKHLCELADLSVLPDAPPALIRVKGVIRATDVLVYVEELPVRQTLASLLKVKRKVSFDEAAILLRPVAEALDFLLLHGRDKINLMSEEIWLTSAQMEATNPGDTTPLLTAVTDWADLGVKFSIMAMPAQGGLDPNGSFDSNMSFAGATQTISGAAFLADTASHPVAAFCRLLYRMITGSDVARDAEFNPKAYINSVALSAASNFLIRDILCQHKSRAGVLALLNDICVYEGVIKPSASATSTMPRDTFSGTKVGTTASGSVNTEPEAIGEVVRPGTVISPFDSEDREIIVPADQWEPQGRITCPYTRKVFKLPRKLDPLLAEPVGVGVIHSPYADPGVNQQVGWDEWVPGRALICSFTGKRLKLPTDLPLPVGVLPPYGLGKVLSPYAPMTQVAVPPELWEPDGKVVCTATGRPFRLPLDLPVLEALADPLKPGILSTPFNPGVQWVVDPPQWEVGSLIACPATGKKLKLPSVVDRWWPETTVVNAEARLVADPFHPGATLEVPANSWKAGGAASCPGARGTILLPKDLPPLRGQVRVGGQPGFVRSPYSGEDVSVPLEKWVPGGPVICPRSGQVFALPTQLPEWVEVGKVAASKPGFVTSPYAPHPQMPVAPLDWVGGKELKCSATGRRFILPSPLPTLQGQVTKGKLGLVRSPFAPGVEVSVSIDDWQPGHAVTCPETQRSFVLPEALEEWLIEGELIPQSPGVVKSPFSGHSRVEVPSAQWVPGGSVECPVAKRKFLVPIRAGFPSLEREKEVLLLALSEPSSSNEVLARKASQIDPALKAEAVQDLLKRHKLDTIDKRTDAQEAGKPLPDAPGFVLSPYGQHPRVPVPPDRWGTAGASLNCPETGRSFRLPADLPPLLAIPLPASPGMVSSPFDTSEPFQVEPALWMPGGSIPCKLSGKPLTLPKDLPEWVPLGTVDESLPGVASSPFGGKARLTVNAADWKPGKVLHCPETGKRFSLPESLPALLALDVRPGSIDTPYAPGSRFAVKADQWREGAIVSCPVSGQPLRLPNQLPKVDWLGEVVAGKPGFLRSPFGSQPEVEVSGTDWRSGAELLCPETRRVFIAPPNLPPLTAFYRGTLGEVQSPYRHGRVIKVPIENWVAGQAVQCTATATACLLPADLPVWEGEGRLTDKPGSVESPYRKGQVQTVPPREWLPGTVQTCKATGRTFRLPKKLPVLEGRVIDGGRGLVASPYDETGSPQAIAPGGWIPGNHVECEKTGREFALPMTLEELALPGVIIPGRAGVILSPYGRRREVTVSGPDWYAGARIVCPDTKNKITLPQGLPPLQGTVVGTKPGTVESPYAKGQMVSVSHKNWMPGAQVICPATKRPLVLPMTLPVWTKKPFPVKAVLLTVAALALIAIVGLAVSSLTSANSGRKPQAVPVIPERKPVAQELPTKPEPHPDPAPPRDELGTLLKLAEKESKLLDESFSISAAEKYCLLLTGILGSSQLDATQRPKYAEELALRKKDIMIHESPLDRETFAGAPSDRARHYFEAKVSGDATEIQKSLAALKERGNALDRYILARVAYDDGKNIQRALLELQAAAESDVKWAQQVLKTGLVAKKDPKLKLTVIDPLGKEPEGILVERQSWSKGAPYESKTPPRWFKLPDDIETLPAPQMIFASKVTAESAESLDLLAAGLRMSVQGTTCQIESGADGKLRVLIPDGMDNQSSLEGTLTLPGWEPKKVKGLQDRSGDYVVSQPIKFQRRTAPLPVTLGKQGCDYDFVEAKWLGPLDSEKSAPGPRGIQTVAISHEGLATRLPTGVYSLELKSERPSVVRPYLFKERLNLGEEKVTADPIELPRSMKGQMIGMTTTVGDGTAIYAAIRIGAKIENVTIVGSMFTLDSTVTYENLVKGGGNGQIAFGPAEGALLSNPTTLEFECLGPDPGIYQKWVIKAEDDGRMWTYISLSPMNGRDDYRRMVERAKLSLSRLADKTPVQKALLESFTSALDNDLYYVDRATGKKTDLFAYYEAKGEKLLKGSESLVKRFPQLAASPAPVVYYAEMLPAGKRYRPQKAEGTDWDLKEVAP